MRGSIDIIAAMDAVVAVTVAGPRTALRRMLIPEKNRDLPEAIGMSFSLTPVARPTPNPSPKGGESEALGLTFAALKPQFAASTDLIPAAAEVLRQAAGQSFTRQQLEAALRQSGLSFGSRTLQNLLPELARYPGICVIKDGQIHSYRWEGLSTGKSGG